VICLWAKPESLPQYNATGKFLTTVPSREILLHFELYELDTKEGTTTVHYGAALPVLYKAKVVGSRSLMIACNLPAPLWVADQSATGTVVTGFPKVYSACLGRLCARGYRPLYSIQWRDEPMNRDCSAIVRFIVPDDHI